MKLHYRYVVLGGTFDTLHSGHVKLLATAALIGDEISVGLTSDSFASTYKQYNVRPFAVRLANLKSLMGLIAPERRVEYAAINDPYGPAVERPEYEAIVVSRETLPRGLQINEERIKRGLRPMDVVMISAVKDGLGNILSSTFIRRLLGIK